MTFVTDGASASSHTLPFGTFTDTEVLIGFQTCRGTAVIYQYYLNTLALYMTKTIPEATSTLAQSHQMRLIAWNFKGYVCKFYLGFFLQFVSCREMGNGHIQFFGRAYQKGHWPSGNTTTIMASSLVWPPSAQEAYLDAGTLVLVIKSACHPPCERNGR